MMALELIVKKVKALFLLFLGLFRRAMCCLKRRRRSSCDSIPLLTVGVVSETPNYSPETEQWDQWEENPVVVVSDKPSNIVQAKIEEYRQQVAKPAIPQQMEPQTDYFEDMAPKITRPKKIVVRKEKKTDLLNRDPSKFAVATDRVPTNELQVWEDNTTTWEDETLQEFANPMEALREQRRSEREKRLLEYHQRRIESTLRPQPLGEKISS